MAAVNSNSNTLASKDAISGSSNNNNSNSNKGKKVFSRLFKRRKAQPLSEQDSASHKSIDFDDYNNDESFCSTTSNSDKENLSSFGSDKKHHQQQQQQGLGLEEDQQSGIVLQPMHREQDLFGSDTGFDFEVNYENTKDFNFDTDADADADDNAMVENHDDKNNTIATTIFQNVGCNPFEQTAWKRFVSNKNQSKSRKLTAKFSPTATTTNTNSKVKAEKSKDKFMKKLQVKVEPLDKELENSSKKIIDLQNKLQQNKATSAVISSLNNMDIGNSSISISNNNNNNSSSSDTASKKMKASGFRLRRMQLAQQRKWKEEHLERAVQSKIQSRHGEFTDDEECSVSSRNSHACRSRKTSASALAGQECLLQSEEGMEISISRHLQKTGFDSSLLPLSSTSRYDINEFHYNHSNSQNCSSNNNDTLGECDNLSYGGHSTGIDTVSSLNSSHYLSDDGLSAKSWQPYKIKSTQSMGSRKSRGSRSRRRAEKETMHDMETQDHIGMGEAGHQHEGYESSMHPPLFVSSIKKVRKSNRKKNASSDDEDDFCDPMFNEENYNKHFDGGNNDGDDDKGGGGKEDENNLTALSTNYLSDEEMLESLMVTVKTKRNGIMRHSKIATSSFLKSNFEYVMVKNDPLLKAFNKSSHDNFNLAVNPLDKTELVPNKLKSSPSTESKIHDKENDIPMKTTYLKIESRKSALRDIPRERPIKSQMLNNNTSNNDDHSTLDQPPTLAPTKSTLSLRRTRLQKISYRQASALEPFQKEKDHDKDDTTADKGISKYHQDITPSKDNLCQQERNNSNTTDNKNMEWTIDISSSSLEHDVSESFMKSSEFPNEKDSLMYSHSIMDLSGMAIEDNIDPKEGYCNDNFDDNLSLKSCKSKQSFATLKTCMTVQASSSEEMQRILKSKQRKIYLLQHALLCTHPHNTDPDDDKYIPCPVVEHCQALCTLINHVQTCTVMMTTGTGTDHANVCEIPGCRAYKKIWNHYRRCVLRRFTGAENRKCRLCSDLWPSKEKDGCE